MRKRIWALGLIGTMLLSITGCNNADATETSGTTSTNQTTTHAPMTQAPEDYTSNPEEIYDYTDDELFMDAENQEHFAVRDERVFIGDEGFQFCFLTDFISTDPDVSPDKNNGAVSVDMFKDQIKSIQIGDKTYAISDLFRSKTEGYGVLEMLAKDFGIKKINETGDIIIQEISAEDLADSDKIREMYSERVDSENHTACTYYINVALNDLDDVTYEKYREAYKTELDLDTTKYLDGLLAVTLYYDINGYDLCYDVIFVAPTYWNDEVNFNANMFVNLRKNVTNLYMLTNDDVKIGIANVNEMTVFSCTK